MIRDNTGRIVEYKKSFKSCELEQSKARNTAGVCTYNCVIFQTLRVFRLIYVHIR